MNKTIQFYYYENVDFCSKVWHRVTRINYECLKRKMFSIKKGTTEINSFFPQTEISEINFNLYGVYLCLFNNLEDGNIIDYDYDLGFNNGGDERIEYDIVKQMIGGQNTILAVVNSRTGMDYKNYTPPLFNYKLDCFIENKYQIISKSHIKEDEYIIAINNIEDYRIIKDHIKAYLIGRVNNIEINASITNFDDINNLKLFTESYDMVIVRTPIFGNYNLAIYSKNDFKEQVGEVLGKIHNEYGCNFTEIIDLVSKENLMVW